MIRSGDGVATPSKWIGMLRVESEEAGEMALSPAPWARLRPSPHGYAEPVFGEVVTAIMSRAGPTDTRTIGLANRQI